MEIPDSWSLLPDYPPPPVPHPQLEGEGVHSIGYIVARGQFFAVVDLFNLTNLLILFNVMKEFEIPLQV